MTVAGTHVDEVQRITSVADELAEVQQVIITAPELGEIEGNFSVRFPEVQVITVVADSAISSGAYRLNLTFPSLDNWYSVLAYDNAFTTCVAWDATAATLEAAIEAMAPIDDVKVTRSGAGTYSSGFGYSYTVSFVGEAVAGNVPQLTVDWTNGTAGNADLDCEAFSAAQGGANVTAVTLADVAGLAGLGTDVEIQTVTVSATARLADGGYKLSLNGSVDTDGFNKTTTACIPYDATAAEFEAALEGLENVDSVYVTRAGDGSGSSGYGYVYSIFFDGVALMQLSNSDDVNGVPPLKVVHDVKGFGSCDPLATLYEGVLTPFADLESEGHSVLVNASLVDDGGYDLAPQSALGLAAKLTRQLELLPGVAVDTSSVSLPDAEMGVVFTLVFAAPAGDLRELVCGEDATMQASDASCAVVEVVDGNVLGGSFLLDGSDVLPYDASAEAVERALEELNGVGDVAVSKGAADALGRTSWLVTFLEAEGDVPALAPTSSLTGAGAALVVEEVSKGNFLGGVWRLQMGEYLSEALDYNASAADVEAAIESLPDAGDVYVTAGAASSEGGSAYTVTFATATGDVASLAAQTPLLTGAGAAVNVYEMTKGSEAVGGSLALSFDAPRFCSESQVDRKSTRSELQSP